MMQFGLYEGSNIVQVSGGVVMKYVTGGRSNDFPGKRSNMFIYLNQEVRGRLEQRSSVGGSPKEKMVSYS